MTFKLQNDEPAPRKRKIVSTERAKQRVLFAGLNCLPGQQNLFETDGQLEEREKNDVSNDQN